MAAVTRGMDFARGILEKYGWKEGMGLGAREDGMVNALRPAIKLDLTGIGHSGESAQFTSRWWEHAYNDAASGIQVSIDKEGVTVKKKKDHNKPKNKHALPPVRTYETMSYDLFVKTSLLENGETVRMRDQNDSINVPKDKNEMSTLPVLSDIDIFRACGKRTIHKGARHGLKLSGKLARLARQEEELSNKLHNVAGGQDKERRREAMVYEVQETIENEALKGTSDGKKDRKKKRNTVQIQDNVPCDLSLDMEPKLLGCAKIKKKKRKKNVEYMNIDIEEKGELILGNETKTSKRKRETPSEEGRELNKNKALLNSSEPPGDIHRFSAKLDDWTKEDSVVPEKRKKKKKKRH